jgi:hypothetical protein
MIYLLILQDPGGRPTLQWRSSLSSLRNLQPGDVFSHEGKQWRVLSRRPGPENEAEAKAELLCERV